MEDDQKTKEFIYDQFAQADLSGQIENETIIDKDAIHKSILSSAYEQIKTSVRHPYDQQKIDEQQNQENDDNHKNSEDYNHSENSLPPQDDYGNNENPSDHESDNYFPDEDPEEQPEHEEENQFDEEEDDDQSIAAGGGGASNFSSQNGDEQKKLNGEDTSQNQNQKSNNDDTQNIQNFINDNIGQIIQMKDFKIDRNTKIIEQKPEDVRQPRQFNQLLQDLQVEMQMTNRKDQEKLGVDGNKKNTQDIIPNAHEEIAKQQIQQKVQFFDSLCYLRRFVRIICHIAILVFGLMIFIFYNIRMNQIDSIVMDFSFENAQNLFINLEYCQLNFIEKFREDERNIMFSYQLKVPETPFDGNNPLRTVSEYSATFNSQTATYELNFLSSFTDIRYCHITVGYPKDKAFSKININCQQKSSCFIVSDRSSLLADSFVIDSLGNATFTGINLKSLEAKEFNFTSDNRGIIQIFDLIIVKNLNVQIGEGEAFFLMNPKRKQVNAQFMLPQDSFCVMAPLIRELSLAQQWSCNISTTSSAPFKDYYLPYVPKQNNSDSTRVQIEAEKPRICKGTTTLCFDPFNCAIDTSLPYLNVSINSGNFYLNMIKNDSAYVNQSDYKYLIGGYYDQGVSLENAIQDTVKKINDDQRAKGDQIFLFQLGYEQMQSSLYQHFFVISNPAFAKVKPYWLTFFSFSLLTASTFQTEGILAPGICPHYKSYDIESLLKIQATLLTNFPNMTYPEVGFIQNPSLKLPQFKYNMNYSEISGVTGYRNDQNLRQDWYKIVDGQEGNKLTKISIQDGPLILYTIILSIICGVWLGLTFSFLVSESLKLINNYLAETCEHYISYAKLSIIGKEEQQELLDQEQFEDLTQGIDINQVMNANKLVNRPLPKISMLINYYGNLLSKKYLINSVRGFCEVLFRPCTSQEKESIKDGENFETQLVQIKQRQLQDLYEKFCFINHHQQQTLTEQINIKLINEYGYTFIDDTEECILYSQIAPKKKISPIDTANLTKTNNLVILKYVT